MGCPGEVDSWGEFPPGMGNVRDFLEFKGVFRSLLAQVLLPWSDGIRKGRVEWAEGDSMICKKCNSEAMTAFPADVRLYLNHSRTRSAAPLSPAPEIAVCLACGFSQFTIAPAWLSAGWLRAFRDTPEMLLKRLVKAARQEEESSKDETIHPAPQAVAQKNSEQQDGAPGKFSECGRRLSRSRRERWDRHH